MIGNTQIVNLIEKNFEQFQLLVNTVYIAMSTQIRSSGGGRNQSNKKATATTGGGGNDSVTVTTKKTDHAKTEKEKPHVKVQQ